MYFVPDCVTFSGSRSTDLNHGALHHSADVLPPLGHPGVQLVQIRGKGQNMWPEIICNPDRDLIQTFLLSKSPQQLKIALTLTVRSPLQRQFYVLSRKYGGWQCDCQIEEDEERWKHSQVHKCLYDLWVQLIHFKMLHFITHSSYASLHNMNLIYVCITWKDSSEKRWIYLMQRCTRWMFFFSLLVL